MPCMQHAFFYALNASCTSGYPGRHSCIQLPTQDPPFIDSNQLHMWMVSRDWARPSLPTPPYHCRLAGCLSACCECCRNCIKTGAAAEAYQEQLESLLAHGSNGWQHMRQHQHGEGQG